MLYTIRKIGHYIKLKEDEAYEAYLEKRIYLGENLVFNCLFEKIIVVS
jgi:hypothetical protein